MENRLTVIPFVELVYGLGFRVTRSSETTRQNMLNNPAGEGKGAQLPVIGKHRSVTYARDTESPQKRHQYELQNSVTLQNDH